MILLSISFLVSLVATLLIVRYEHMHHHVSGDHDLKGVQKFHATTVTRIGGVGVMLGLIGAEMLELVLGSEAGIGFLVIVASLPAFVAGLIEDLTKRVSVSKRLLATACSAILGGLMIGGWLTRLDIPGADSLIAISFISVLATCLAVAGVVNAFNLIDGYNGLAAMVAIMVLCGLAYVANRVGDQGVVTTSLISVGAVLGFLVWNYPRGLIFLGDSGAYLIGFFVAELSVLLVARNPEVSPWFPLLLAFYPVFETLFTMFRRLVISKSNLGLPDAAHLHQLIYHRVVRWAIDDDCPKRRTERNSLTSPYLWAIAAFAVIPATIFWNNTAVLQVIALLYASFYIWLYWQIYNGKVPTWLSIKNRK